MDLKIEKELLKMSFFLQYKCTEYLLYLLLAMSEREHIALNNNISICSAGPASQCI